MAGHYKQINDVDPENVADILNVLDSDGYTEWEVYTQEEKHEEVKINESVAVTSLKPVKMRVLAWKEEKE